MCGSEAALRANAPDSISQELQQIVSILCQRPPVAMFADQPATWILVVFRFVDRQELKSRLVFEFGSGTGNQPVRNAVAVQRDIVSGRPFLFDEGIWLDQLRVAFQPGKIRASHPD